MMNSLSCYFAHKSMSQFLRYVKIMDKSAIAVWKKTSTCWQLLSGCKKSFSQEYTDFVAKIFKVNFSMHILHFSVAGCGSPQFSSKIFYRIRRSGSRFEIINFALAMCEFFLLVLMYTSLLIPEEYFLHCSS